MYKSIITETRVYDDSFQKNLLQSIFEEGKGLLHLLMDKKVKFRWPKYLFKTTDFLGCDDGARLSDSYLGSWSCLYI